MSSKNCNESKREREKRTDADESNEDLLASGIVHGNRHTNDRDEVLANDHTRRAPEQLSNHPFSEYTRKRIKTNAERMNMLSPRHDVRNDRRKEYQG